MEPPFLIIKINKRGNCFCFIIRFYLIIYFYETSAKIYV